MAEREINARLSDDEAAKIWAEDYIKSGYSQKKLLECNAMSLNQVAMVTKVLMVLEKEFSGPLCMVWKKSEFFFGKVLEKIGRSKLTKNHFFDQYLENSLNVVAIHKMLKRWDPSLKSKFSTWVIGQGKSDRIRIFFSELNENREDFREFRKYILGNHDLFFAKPENEKISALFYSIFLFIDEYPHKILIFTNGGFYWTNKNISWKSFYRDHAESTLEILCGNLVMNYNKSPDFHEFTYLLKNYYQQYLLTIRAEIIYPGANFENLIRRIGKDTSIGVIKINDFFFDYYTSYPSEYDWNPIRDVISSWNSRLMKKFEAFINGTDFGRKQKNQMLDLIDF